MFTDFLPLTVTHNWIRDRFAIDVWVIEHSVAAFSLVFENFKSLVVFSQRLDKLPEFVWLQAGHRTKVKLDLRVFRGCGI